MHGMAYQTLMIALMVLGFGFVIFWHELGHFLAAKWVGIKVEQFAVGMGHAMFAWRKGIGFRVGSTAGEHDRRVGEYLLQNKLITAPEERPVSAVRTAEEALGLGETEYRLNWLPLGGYVKMLGQDDLNPNADYEDPRAYNRKSVPARMLVVSAGVIMNVILAAIGFMIVFSMGMHVLGPIVGSVLADSPAQRAGLQPGDVIDTYAGKKQWDFVKIGMNVALSEDGKPEPLTYTRDGVRYDTTATPGHMGGRVKDLMTLGIRPAYDLSASKDLAAQEESDTDQVMLDESHVLEPGDVITAINSEPVKITDFAKLDQAIQRAGAEPVLLSIRGKSGVVRTAKIYAHAEEPFSAGSFHLAGMEPRARITGIEPKSPARKLLFPGDAIISVKRNGDVYPNPTLAKVHSVFIEAAKKSEPLSFVVLRNEKRLTVDNVPTGFKLADGNKGVGVRIGLDELHPVVAAEGVLQDTPASRAGVPNDGSATLTAVNETPVSNWFDLRQALSAVGENVPFKLHFKTARGDASVVSMTIDHGSLGAIQCVRYGADVQEQLAESTLQPPRKSDSIAQAAWWGIGETRDLILQAYLTLHRMFAGSVSPSNMSGPIGIFNTGRIVSVRGSDWLIWFLSMISANLAVVNFLPIPIVDGGLFTFLILEKLQGKPLSPQVQSFATKAGLVFLAGIFIFVTYHDITRML